MENYTITKEQILELHESYSPETRLKIAKMFPEALKKELEIGKWYKVNGNKCIFKITDISGKNIKAYGFDYNGKYIGEKWDFGNTDSYLQFTEATPEEIESALREEVKKIGFKEGTKIRRHFEGLGDKTIDSTEYPHDPEFNYDHIDDYLEFHGFVVYSKGRWAEIIPEETKQITMDKAIKILSKKYGKKVEINL